MKILLVINSLTVGGAERLVTNLADRYVELGHEVTLAYLLEGGEDLLLPESREVNLVHLKLERTFLGFLKCLFNLRRLIVGFQPDIVNSHMYHSNILCRLVRVFTSLNCLISSAHSTNEGGFFRMMIYRATDRLTNISTNVSYQAVETFLKKKAVKKGRMIAIPNGIDVNKFSFDSTQRTKIRSDLDIEDCYMLLAVGRLDTQKDYPNLLNAIALLKHQQNFKLFIVGDGSLKSALIQLTIDLKIEDVVEFLGTRSDVPSLMSASDIFVLSSAFEGFGLVVAEAMACERVVVATDCGGVREVVGADGILVEPKNYTALAYELNKVLNMNGSYLKNIGKTARQRVVDKYSLKITADAYIRLYSRCL